MYRFAPLLLLAACSLDDRSAVPVASPDASPIAVVPVDTVTTIQDGGLDTCIQGAVAMPLDCTVSDVQAMGTPNEVDTLMAPCKSGLTFPCWYSAADASCPPSGLALVVVRTTPAPTDSIVLALCAL
ncbi:MAG TPA: hypothetical protein VGL61_09115 [Kofleriaceae bacterium]|jgi:hypothetical protein